MIYHIIVKPNSRKQPAVIETADRLVVHVRAKAVDGAANRELIETLAKHFGVSKTCVSIKRGEASRYKAVEIVS